MIVCCTIIEALLINPLRFSGDNALAVPFASYPAANQAAAVISERHWQSQWHPAMCHGTPRSASGGGGHAQFACTTGTGGSGRTAG